jgi:hypothetical protein
MFLLILSAITKSTEVSDRFRIPNIPRFLPSPIMEHWIAPDDNAHDTK